MGLTDWKTYKFPSGPIKNGTQVDKDFDDLAGALGTAAVMNVPAAGDAASGEVVKGNDSRLTNSRPASDVYAWAKAATKPTYIYSEVGAAPLSHTHAESDVTNLATDLAAKAIGIAAATAGNFVRWDGTGGKQLGAGVSSIGGSDLTNNGISHSKLESSCVEEHNIHDAAVTLAKMANLAQNNILGRITGSTGVPEALSAANVRTILSIKDIKNIYLDSSNGPVSYVSAPTTILTRTVTTTGSYFLVFGKSYLSTSGGADDSGALRFSLWVDGNEYDYSQEHVVTTGAGATAVAFEAALTAIWFGQVASGDKIFKTTMQYTASAYQNKMVIVEFSF
jgi:hypothetical protein